MVETNETQISGVVRVLRDHAIDPADPTVVLITDEPGAGGVNHRYEVVGFDADTNDSCPEGWTGRFNKVTVLFQNGPVCEWGYNGLTQEILLSIVADRLRGFQSGPYPSANNAEALTYVEKALEALLQRTRERMARGVEGTHQA